METERWFHLNSGAGDPALNMAWDEALLEGAAALGAPVLRFYGWSVPAATYGISQGLEDAARLTSLRPLIRRPTGGGVVPHDRDWTYTLVFPPTHWWYASPARESYQRVHAWVQSALARIGLETQLAPNVAQGAPTHCFVRAEQFDVLWRGAKVAGAAQRRRRDGFLIQGSVQAPPGADQGAWERAMREVGTANWHVEWEPLVVGERFLERAAELATTKYSPGVSP
jgi:lipoate-protein ligase A